MNNTVDSDWFRGLGLGMFLHWGHASSRGWELSWQMTGGVHLQNPPLEPVSCEDYFANAADFNPSEFDPVAWADLAWRSGVRYVVFTAKHHDGFAMYDTKLSDYSITKHSPFGRDVTAEIVEAFRDRGMRIGLYFSIIDWHHTDYPRYADELLDKPYIVGRYPRSTPAAWSRYRTFMLGQLDELLTSYGKLDLLWLDGEFEHTAEEWDFADIRDLIRRRQPDCLVNDRCVGFGDFLTPEQQLPISAPDQPWECCITMNSTWGYVPGDDSWKDPASLVHTFVEAASMGGNLLLNVGPTGEGQFPPQAVARLETFARWMDRHGESVRDVRPGLQLWQFHGPSTRRVEPDGSERLYLHLVMRPYGQLLVRGLPVGRIRAVTMLGTGTSLDFAATPQLKDIHAGLADPTGELRIDVPTEILDEVSSVIAVDIDAG